ncbi:hypothetical protein BC374_16350 [Ensifer sp. LC13]|nr:hypothetical protein BC362_14655 [Ensifer sp. LC14]OCP11844.1 hypothetical protein BC374_16350 [Ensifer sp. LC13]OCP12401.1 hypothetical protein BBX50_16550 [Ensifer sp. LC11]OCP33632.1 hypothetical protein BC364_15295 [Ensifer sp. LC499]
MDTRQYLTGMNQKIAADKAGAASSNEVGAALARTDAQAGTSGGALAMLSRMYIDGYKNAAGFEQAVSRLGRAIDKGAVPMDRVDTILTGIYRRYGLVANGADLAAAGQHQLAAAATVVHAKLAAEEAALDSAALAHRRLAMAANDNGVGQRQLAFQLNDVFQSWALGMPIIQILLQQGPQIAQIYGPGEGGIGRAFRETATMATSLIARLWPLAAAAAGVYGAYEILTRNSAAAAYEVGSLTRALAEQAVSAGSVTSMISELTSIQTTYDRALSATAGTHGAMTATILANTEKEFNAKKSLLEIQLRYQQALLDSQRADIRRTGHELKKEIAQSVFPNMGEVERGGFYDPKVGNLVRLPDEITALRKTQEIIDASPISLELKKMQAELALNEVAALRLQDALKLTFNAAGSDARAAGLTVRQAAVESRDAWDGLRKPLGTVSEQLKLVTQQADEHARMVRDTAGGAIRDFFSTIERGGKAWEAFGDAGMGVLDRLTDKLLNDALDAIGQVNGALGSGGGSGGILAALFGGGRSQWGIASGGGLGLYANGGVFGRTGLTAFAKGGAFTNQIVDRPTLFPFAKGTGLMGEAGPEAIMPLRRDATGRLGVLAAVGRPTNQGGVVRFEFHSKISVSGNGDKELMERMRLATEQQMQAGFDEFSRAVLPGRVSEINNDPYAVG